MVYRDNLALSWTVGYLKDHPTYHPTVDLVIVLGNCGDSDLRITY